VRVVSLVSMPVESKVLLLKELGYFSDGTYVLDASGQKVYDKYINEPIQISNMAIFPGDPVLLDDNPLSIIHYLEEYERSVEAEQIMAKIRIHAQEIEDILTRGIDERRVREVKRQHSIITRIKKRLTVLFS